MEDNALKSPRTGYVAFLKIVHYQHEYAGLMYYIDGYDGTMLKLSFLKVNGKKDNCESPNLSHPCYTSLTEVNFDTYNIK